MVCHAPDGDQGKVCMDRRDLRHYTIWFARTGQKPIVFSLRSWGIALMIGMPIALVTLIVGWFVYQNRQLSYQNSQLTKDAEDIVHQLESLESTLTTLQERAGFSNSAETRGAEASDAPIDADFEDADFESSFENPDGKLERWQSLRNFRETEAQSEQADNAERLQSRGGGVTSAAEVLLAMARAKLPLLHRQLEGEVEPALTKLIVRQETKPDGAPLKAIDTEITSRFGLRSDPFGWGYEFHQGIDFVAAYGSPIYATAPGIVEKAEWEPGFGNHVIVDHGYGYQTLYGHLSDIKVEAGERIARFQVVGYLGNTGRSSGPHLHYSVFQNGQAVDPMKYLK